MDLAKRILQKKELPQKDVILTRMHKTKRSYEGPQDNGAVTKKRSVLGDLTNAEKHSLASISSLDDTVFKSSQDSTSKRSENSLILSSQESAKNISTCSTSIDDSAKVFDPISDVLLKVPELPVGVTDFDLESKDVVHAEALYAMQIFEYYKQREKNFVVKRYMQNQKEVTKGMRAVLIDWMVEVQESFELNHETLYLAVRLMDLYLMKQFVSKTSLQLVGATAVLIACKYDERQPPLIDDFLYICDDSYTRYDMVKMEKEILLAVNFELGIPSSYRFLRRFARTMKSTMELLTLARYILELSLMDYELVEETDSKMAAAALYLALKMENTKSEWTPSLQYYSGYTREELLDLVKHLNKNLSTLSKNLQTVRMKYSHRIFYEVAKLPPLEFF